ncbi:MAG: hypothetical protein HQ546_11440, partial [Planctomycetes bacterium]|nr:hypothetical protein [Planctomycetota bacterium]
MTTTASFDNRTDRRAQCRGLRELAVRALSRMYLPAERLFAFRIRRTPAGDRLEGVSRRYTAIVLIALAGEDDSIAEQIFCGQTVDDVYRRLLDGLDDTDDIGEVALALWACRIIGHPRAGEALARLRAMDSVGRPYPTVEIAWCLTALSVGGDGAADGPLAGAIADRL